MIAKMPKKSREFLEAECVRIANGQIEGRGTERVTIKRLFVKGTGSNWDVDQIQPQLSSVADREVRDAIKKLSGRLMATAKECGRESQKETTWGVCRCQITRRPKTSEKCASIRSAASRPL